MQGVAVQPNEFLSPEGSQYSRDEMRVRHGCMHRPQLNDAVPVQPAAFSGTMPDTGGMVQCLLSIR